MLTRLEKKVLIWMAARTPGWVSPDGLTAIGFLGSVLIFVSYAMTVHNAAYLWLASLGFVINWFGDSLDGNLARYRKIERPRYGFFIDHIIDTISEVLIFIGLGLSPYLRFELALLALVCYLVASIYVYLTTYVNGIFRISFTGISPTTLRILAIAANTIVYFAGNPFIKLPLQTFIPTPYAITLYDLVIITVVLVIIVLFLINSYTTARQLSSMDAAERSRKKRRRRAQTVNAEPIPSGGDKPHSHMQ
jgi:phosphatidylglycerophosphate synthase